MRPALVPILLADPMSWAYKASYAWDFLRDRARFAGGYRGGLANTPGWSYTRADSQNAYAQTSAGVLTPFATGVLRRTDKGVLIEGARTNLCLQSQTFDNATWTKVRSSVSADTVAAPDGTLTADTLVEDTTVTASHELRQNIGKAAASITYTASIFIKAATRSWARVIIADSAGATNAGYSYFNVGSGAVGSTGVFGAGFTFVSSSITALANGWYRCILTVTTDAGTGLWLNVSLASGDGGANYTGDGTSGLYLWGAQLEAASFPSSYVPTVAASATRAADVLTVPVSGIDYPISLFAEFESGPLDTTASRTLLTCDNGASNDRAELYISTAAGTRAKMALGGATQADLAAGSAIVASTAYKLAGRYNTNSVNAALGGALGTTDTSATLPATPARITFGNLNGSTQFAGAYLRRAALWTRALTDSELQTVTT